MTNIQIITIEAIRQGLYTSEEVERIFASGGTLPLATYAEWKRMGYQVRKGEKAVLKCKIWKPRRGMSLEKFNLLSEGEQDEEKSKGSFFLVNASFFNSEQVDLIEKPS